MKIGIMGGTFDPIHIGHLIAAERAREEAGLDEIWFIPSNVPPHKDRRPEAAPRQRLDMVRLAVSGNPHFKVCDVELKRGGISYTIDTILQLKQQFPGFRFYIIIGGDMVQYLPQWHRIGELLQLVRFIGLERPGTKVDFPSLGEAIAARVTMVPMPQLDISSTQIRGRRAKALSIRYLVPESVHQYIEENGLYAT